MPAREGKSKEKIKSHINTPEQYKYYLSQNCEDKDSMFYLTKKEYTDFLKMFFDEVVEAMMFSNTEIVLPFKTGVVCIRKYKKNVRIENGKLINKLPIDFNATLALWERDAEAKENKTIVRHLNKNRMIYRFVYYKSRARYKNKEYYWFKPTRTNKLKLKKCNKSRNNRSL